MIIIDNNGVIYIADYTKEESDLIEKLWKIHCGPYIVDPVKHDQALYIMFNELPYLVKQLHFPVKPRIIRNNKDMFSYYYEKY